MYRKSKCRISLGLIACSCVPSGRGTLSLGTVATQCKQFCPKTLSYLAIVVHATSFLIAPSVALYALCPAERQCDSTHKRSCLTAHSGIHSALFIILMPPASTCCGGTSCRAIALPCWQRSYSSTALFCTSRISFFDGNTTVLKSSGLIYGCENRLAILPCALPLFSLPATHPTTHLVMRSVQ
jgi:hypothetical protein